MMRLLTISILIFSNLAFSIEMNPRKMLLSIGINEFDDKLFNNFNYASKDSEDVISFFENHGFEIFKQKISTRANKDEILNLINRINHENRLEDDTVVIYISTHGTRDIFKGVEHKYLVTSDTNESNLANTAIKFEDLLRKFEHFESKKKALILGTCYSGVGKSAYSKRYQKLIKSFKGSVHDDYFFESEGSLLFSASGSDQRAIEDSKLKNDIYTYFLLKNLEEDYTKLGWASLSQSHYNAAISVYKYTDGNQMPSMQGYLTGSDPIIVAGSPDKYGIKLFHTPSQKDNLIVSLDNQTTSFKNGVAEIKPGFHKLCIKDLISNETVTRNVNFKSGKEYSVREFLIPFYKHEFSLGYSVLSYNFDNISTPIYGSSISLRLSEFYKDYDINIDFSYYEKKNEEMTISRIKYMQDRQNYTFTLNVTQANNINLLSKRDGSLQTKFRLGSGLTYNNMSIKRYEDSFYEKNIYLRTVGLSSNCDLVLNTHHNVNLGISFYGSIFPKEQNKHLLSYGSRFFAGVFW